MLKFLHGYRESAFLQRYPSERYVCLLAFYSDVLSLCVMGRVRILYSAQ